MELKNNCNSEKNSSARCKDYVTGTKQEIQEQLDTLCDLARSDIIKAFNISLMKIEYLENLVSLYREMLEEENKLLAENCFTFKKIKEHCEIAVAATIPVDPEVIIEIVRGETM